MLVTYKKRSGGGETGGLMIRAVPNMQVYAVNKPDQRKPELSGLTTIAPCWRPCGTAAIPTQKWVATQRAPLALSLIHI